MKKNISDIPQGYKDSPLGIIPKEWEVKRISISYRVQGGYAFKSELFTNKGTAIIRISNISANRNIDLSDCVYYSNTESIGAQFKVTYGNILIALSGATTGKSAMYCSNTAAYLNQRVGIFKQINSIIDNLFLYYWIDSNIFQNQLNLLLIAGAQPNISPKDLENIRIIIPPLSEQQKIAEILSIWDEAIEKQSQLVEKLELRKKGLMQQLLTGRKRLPGFVEEWKKARLGDFTDVVGGGTPDTSNENYWYGNIAWFTPSEIGKNKYVYKSQRYITEEGLNNSSARLLPIGTILFTSRATIGLKAILKMEATTNQGFQSLIVSNSNNTDFFFYLLDILDNVIKRKASGSTFPEISAKSLKNIMISIPSLAEQNAIAEILSSCDKEISLANRKLNTLRKEKKGLMQVLLTGKKRIV